MPSFDQRLNVRKFRCEITYTKRFSSFRGVFALYGADSRVTRSGRYQEHGILASILCLSKHFNRTAESHFADL
ncbi:hypothetical protein GCM10011499_18160 [Pelagibacterium lentulum]|uniref:Uncharacterized protein n=1 Tax=Pelagibacterium lentulum TaxID=2029865 RepID=A0A916RBQ2_9HYPH|nr:hypothetical protein GCM10011499_18160 [Pelagibacterium lentulum]